MNQGTLADAVIAGAGRSQRMYGVDKILVLLADRPLLCHSVEVFEASPLIGRIVVVLRYDAMERGRALALARGWKKVRLCVGGERRQDSVRAGLDCLQDATWVVVHDAARPLVTEDLIKRGLEAARRTGAAAAAVPVANTIKLADADGLVLETLPRDRLRVAQTPQVFRYPLLLAAHQTAATATDDAALVEALGHSVALYEGSTENIKVTNAVDLAVAEAILQQRQAIALARTAS